MNDSFLKQQYDRSTFLSFVKDFLPGFKNDISPISVINNSLFKEAELLGHALNGEVSILEIECIEDSRNRKIAVTKEAFRILKNHGVYNAIIAFHYARNEWRLSLLTTTLNIKNQGGLERQESSPRRYSYLLGKSAKTHTPFQFLVDKGAVIDLSDLRSRFSLEVVNKQFYNSIAELFTRLVGGIHNNKQYEPMLHIQGHDDYSQPLQEFAVRLIGRLVFCWFLKEKKSKKDKPLVPSEILSSKKVNDYPGYYHKILEPLFFETLNRRMDRRRGLAAAAPFCDIPYLNGGLFNPQKGDNGDYYEFNGSHGVLTIADDWFEDFFDLLSTYNFTVDENTSYDMDLSIDPEMLGRIFENLLAEINPETGESARKVSGSFYTPREIVEYMVDSTLTDFLVARTSISKSKIQAVISYGTDDDDLNPLDSEEKRQIVDGLSELTILDPACGSGAFPIGILQKVVYVLQQIDDRAEIWLERQLANVSPELERFLRDQYRKGSYDYLRKLGVIRESIFGVDVQPIATEIARLRCFLTLIVEEPIDDDADNRGIQPLPNLEFKFVTANSLVQLPQRSKSSQGSLLEDTSHIDALRRIRARYFGASSDEKADIIREFNDTQKAMLKNTIDVYAGQSSELYDKLMRWEPFNHEPTDWFDPEWMFGVSAFNIVIANPPYIDSEVMVRNAPDLRNYCTQHYPSAKGNWDIFIPFIELGRILSSDTGGYSFIIPNKLIAAPYASTLRTIINNEIVELRDYSNVKVFEEADVYPIILVANKNNSENGSVTLSVMNSVDGGIKSSNSVSPALFHDSTNWDVLFAKDQNAVTLIEKMRQHKALGDVAFVSGSATVGEAYEIKNLLFESERSADTTNELRLINTGTIDRYRSLWGVKNTQYIKQGYKYPALRRDALNALYPRRLNDGESTKVIIGGMTKVLECYYDEGEYLAGKSTTLVTGSSVDLKYIIAILNSKLMSAFYAIYFSSLSLNGGFFRIGPPQVKQLPIAIPSNQKIEEVVSLVDELLLAIDANPHADTQNIEQGIDNLIYRLYGLTKDEIHVVESMLVTPAEIFRHESLIS